MGNFDENLIDHLKKIQNKSSSCLHSRININISKEELDRIIYSLNKTNIDENYITYTKIIYNDRSNVNKDIDIIKIYRDDGVRYCKILYDKKLNRYRFVNLTKEHEKVCECVFESIDDALKDLDRFKSEGKVIKYEYVQFKEANE